jgi:hypothetical protein
MMVFMLSTILFAQDGRPRKHEASDMLLGINAGLGAMFSGDIISLNAGSFVFAADLGLTYDFYIFRWLSATTGVMLHPQLSVILKEDIAEGSDLEFTDILQSPVCITIPFQVHLNVPFIEWLYAGFGVNINIPFKSMLSNIVPDELGLPDTRGGVFISLPIDLGFDMIKPGGGGGRFFFRATPSFLENGVVMPVGFIWQIYNFRIYHKK